MFHLKKLFFTKYYNTFKTLYSSEETQICRNCHNIYCNVHNCYLGTQFNIITLNELLVLFVILKSYYNQIFYFSHYISKSNNPIHHCVPQYNLTE